MEPSTKLNNNWSLWYHHEKDNWKLSGYKKIYDIETISDFWKLNNNWDKMVKENKNYLNVVIKMKTLK